MSDFQNILEVNRLMKIKQEYWLTISPRCIKPKKRSMPWSTNPKACYQKAHCVRVIAATLRLSGFHSNERHPQQFVTIYPVKY